MANQKLTVFGRQSQFPYNDILSDREFEELLYTIFDKHIEVGVTRFTKVYDSAHFMTGVGEQGRDILLTKNSKNVGLIQCKRVQTSLNKPLCAKEIIKFALNAICNPKLITDKRNFVYYLAASTGFTKPAIEMIASFNDSILQEPDLESWTVEVIKGYKSFKHLDFSSIEVDLKSILSSITVVKIIPTDLNVWLTNYPLIAKHFFPTLIISGPVSDTGGISVLISQSFSALAEAELLIKNFQAKQASTIIKVTEKTLEISNIPIENHNSIQAKVHYLNAFIKADAENDMSQFNNLIIKAYGLQKDKKEYKERAARVYYDRDEIDRAYSIAESLIAEDEDNSRAWVVMHQIKPELTVPKFVLSSAEYKVGLIGFLKSNDGNVAVKDIKNIFSEEIQKKPIPDVIDRFNIFYWDFVAQVAMQDVFEEGLPVSLIKYDNLINNNQLKYACDIFSKILEHTENTDFQFRATLKLTKFNYYFCLYFLTNDSDKAKEVAKHIYHSFIGSDRYNFSNTSHNGLINETAPSIASEVISILLQQNLETLVLELNKLLKKPFDLNIYILLGITYSRLDRTEDMIKSYTDYLSNVNFIDQDALADCCEIINTLFSINYKIDNIVSSILNEKAFESSEIHSLFNIYFLTITGKENTVIKEKAEELLLKLNSFSDSSKRILASIFTTLQDWPKAKQLWHELTNTSSGESNDLRAYLYTLFEGRTDLDKLSAGLDNWRKNYTPDLILTIRESVLYRKLRDYNKLIEVSEYGVKHFPDTATFWIDLIRALHRINNKTDLIPLLDERILRFDLIPEVILSAAHIYIINGKEDLGLEACYRVVKNNWFNPKIKLAYLSITSNYKLFDSRLDPEQAEEWMVVRIQGREHRQLIELTPEIIQYDNFAKKIIGLHVNESFEYVKSITNDKQTFFVDNIYDKYQGIAALITEEIFNKPYNDYNVQAFQLPSTQDGKLILEEIQKVIGPEGTKNQIIFDEYINKFTNADVGIMELSLNIFKGNFINAWQYVTSNFEDGVPIISNHKLINSQITYSATDEKEFVLDFSSVMNLHQIFTVDRIGFENKMFMISPYIFDYVGTEVERLNNERFSELSLTVTIDRISTVVHPEELRERQLAFYNSLYEWINKFCRPGYAWEKISWDIKASENLFPEDNLVVSSMFDSLLLANNSKRVLITDDLFVYNNIPSKTLNLSTTEHFLRNSFNSSYKNHSWRTLVKMNMRGLSLTAQNLYDLFIDNKLSTNKNNDYEKALYSLSPKYNSSPVNIVTGIKFLKKVHIDDLSLEYKSSITRKILYLIFKNNQNVNDSYLERIFSLIDNEFLLLGSTGESIKAELRLTLKLIGY